LTNPDEDFVVIAPLVDNGKTKVISGDELKQIKERGIEAPAGNDTDEEELDAELEDDEEDEDEEEGLNPKMDKAVSQSWASS